MIILTYYLYILNICHDFFNITAYKWLLLYVYGTLTNCLLLLNYIKRSILQYLHTSLPVTRIRKRKNFTDQ